MQRGDPFQIDSALQIIRWRLIRLISIRETTADRLVTFRRFMIQLLAIASSVRQRQVPWFVGSVGPSALVVVGVMVKVVVVVIVPVIMGVVRRRIVILQRVIVVLIIKAAVAVVALVAVLIIASLKRSPRAPPSE